VIRKEIVNIEFRCGSDTLIGLRFMPSHAIKRVRSSSDLRHPALLTNMHAPVTHPPTLLHVALSRTPKPCDLFLPAKKEKNT
jgi:hypothetical protein